MHMASVPRVPKISPDHVFHQELEDALGLREPNDRWNLHAERSLGNDDLFAEEQELERAFSGSITHDQLCTPVGSRQTFRQTSRMPEAYWEQPPKVSSSSSRYQDSMDTAALMSPGMWNNQFDMSQSQISSNSTHPPAPPANLQRSMWQLWRCQGDLSSEVVAQSAQLRSSQEEASCWRAECNFLKSELAERDYFVESRTSSPGSFVSQGAYAPASSSAHVDLPTNQIPSNLPWSPGRSIRNDSNNESRNSKAEAFTEFADSTSKIASRTISDKMAELLALRRKMHSLVGEGSVLGVRTPSPPRGGLHNVLRDLQRDSQERLGELRHREPNNAMMDTTTTNGSYNGYKEVPMVVRSPSTSRQSVWRGTGGQFTSFTSPSLRSSHNPSLHGTGEVYKGNQIANSIEELHRDKFQSFCTQHASWDGRA